MPKVMEHFFMKQILCLGSTSRSRQQLLREAQIPFKIVPQLADETVCDWGLPFLQLLETIAVYKMNHVQLPDDHEKEVCFVLTADTLGCDIDGVIHGKPRDREDAIKKIKALRRGGSVATAFCLDKKIWKGDSWRVEERILECISTRYVFDMPDSWIELYLEAVPHYLDIGGAITVDGFGAQFLKEIQGSYSTILGLPMFEVRGALEKLGFFSEIHFL
jgi:septum formation protein